MAEQVAGLILMVLTSHGQIDAEHPTGVWLEEFAVPYEIFIEAGYDVTVASVKGGKVPVDPRSTTEETLPENAEEALAALEHTVPLAEVDLERHDAVFFPGGHGTMFDLPDSESVHTAVRLFMQQNKPTALVCHGPAALVGVTYEDGTPIVKGRKVTSFTNEEEDAVELTDAMPFLLETRLRELGAAFAEADNFQEHVVTDANLITGQNPASSGEAARALIAQLQTHK